MSDHLTNTAVIDGDGKVENVIARCTEPGCEDHPEAWALDENDDPVSTWPTPDGATLVDLTEADAVSPGDTYENGEFIPKPIPEPVNPNQATHEALDGEGALATALGRATCRNGGCITCEV